MCGIFCCYNREGDVSAFRPRAIALSKRQRHRGPDWSGCYIAKDTILVHERLAIVGVGEFARAPDFRLNSPQILVPSHWSTRTSLSSSPSTVRSTTTSPFARA